MSKKKITKNNFHDNFNDLTRIKFKAEEMLRKNPDKFWSSKISDEVKLNFIKELIADLVIEGGNDLKVKILKEIARDY